MGDRSVSDSGTPGAGGTPLTSPSPSGSSRWKLQPDVAALTQGLVASNFGHLPASAALFLTLPTQPMGLGGGWLAALRALLPISDAAGSRADGVAAAIAFTASGLAAMNLDPAVLVTFSAPFREGMHQADRARRLQDDPALGTVVAGGARWSANIPDALLGMADQPQPTTPITVHALLLVYAADSSTLAAQLAPLEALLMAHRISIGHRRWLGLGKSLGVSLGASARAATGASSAVSAVSDGVSSGSDDPDPPREHFGFADGISQPVPTGQAIVPASGPQADAQRHWHGVQAGEILLGHTNLHDELAPGPLVSSSSPGSAVLSRSGAPEGFCNLGLNGSYLVVRELHQDVAAFWQAMDSAAAQLANPTLSAQQLAEKMVGRTLDGHALRPGGPISADGDEPANNFGYAQADLHGLGCPLGAHVRRSNPRDALPSRDGAATDLSVADELLASANGHRILRRGRKYGPGLADLRQDDGIERGLLFMCLNSDLVRHFEFVQQTWLLNPSFATLFNETDPLLGPPGRFTVPASPLRLRPAVQTFVQMLGGEYFFLPSLPALDYLASLAAVG